MNRYKTSIAPPLRGGKECSQHAPAGSPGRSRQPPPSSSWSPVARSAQIGGDSGSGGSAGTTEISFLYQNDSATQALGKALIDGVREAENPDIKVTSETQPGGTDGDNLMKTKLSTGEMSDVFHYNPGSLFQALNPDTNLQPLTDEPWVSQMTDEMKAVVSTTRGPTVRRSAPPRPAASSTTRRSTPTSA